MGVGVALQAAGLVVGLAAAKQQKDIAEMEAQAYEEQANTAEITTLQQEEERRAQLRRQLSALGTSMSSQGVALGNYGSIGGIKTAEMDLAKKDIASIKLMGMSNRRKYEISAAGSRASGRAAMTLGVGQALGQAYSINKGVGRTGTA